MVNGDRRDAEMRDFEFLGGRNRDILNYRAIVVFQFGESRINVPIENIPLQKINHYLSSIDSYWAF